MPLSHNISRGKSGEDAAADYLLKKGYRVVVRNYRTKCGEIDIIAWDKDTLCFVEVKTRSSRSFGLPWEAISRVKQRQLSKTALCFLKEKRLFEKKARFDVIAVTGDEGSPEIEIIRSAFELDPAYGY